MAILGLLRHGSRGPFGAGSLLGRNLSRAGSGVGLDVLHDDDDLPVRVLRNRVPDRQAV
jgi:hypothetical protein